MVTPMEIERNLLPRIGTQFFINMDETDDEIAKHFQIMKEYGIKLVRLFVLWSHIEPKEDQWSFEKYDKAYNLAHLNGIKIISTLTVEDPPAWKNITPFYHHHTNLNDPSLKESAKVYIQKLVLRYKNHPAHYAWLLMNEPELKINYDLHTMKQFGLWLKNKYGSISEFNNHWFSTYNSFEDIQIDPEKWNNFWTCFNSFVDWHEFLKSNLTDQLIWVRDEITKYDTISPTHINPKDFFGRQAAVGQDIWKEGKIVDILGATIHPAWNFTQFNPHEYGLAFGYCIDLIRSASGGNSFWVTELQSGSTLMTGLQPFTPSPDNMTAWVWDAIGAGAKSIIYWMWHPRTFGQEAGEWGIVSNNHKISSRLIASAKISNLLESHANFFSNAKPELPKVAILYNQVTEILSMVEGTPSTRKPNAPLEATLGVYMALMSSNIPVDIISANQIQSGELSKYSALFLPYAYALHSETQESICTFVKNGGRLWADAPCSWKTDSGALSRHSSEFLSNVFGITVNEYLAASKDFTLEFDNNQVPSHAFISNLSVTSGTVINTFCDGSPAIVENHYGDGMTYFIGTPVSLGHFASRAHNSSNTPHYSNMISTPVQDLGSSFVKISCVSSSIMQRILYTQDEFCLILENWGNDCDVSITLPSANYTKAYDITNKKSLAINMINKAIEIQIPTKETVVILFSY